LVAAAEITAHHHRQKMVALAVADLVLIQLLQEQVAQAHLDKVIMAATVVAPLHQTVVVVAAAQVP
jgi:hypothetical protein